MTEHSRKPTKRRSLTFKERKALAEGLRDTIRFSSPILDSHDSYALAALIEKSTLILETHRDS